VAGIACAQNNDGVAPEFNTPQEVWVKHLATIIWSYVGAQGK
jgi:hypothetical protein